MRNENVSVARVWRAELLGHPSHPGAELDTRLRAAPGGANRIPEPALQSPRSRGRPHAGALQSGTGQGCEPSKLPKASAAIPGPRGRHPVRTLGIGGETATALPAGDRRAPPERASGVRLSLQTP